MGTIPKPLHQNTHTSVAKELEETKELLRKIEAVANIGHWEVDLVTGKNTWSDQFFRILGMDPATTQACAELGLSMIHPDDKDRANQSYQKSTTSGAPYRVEKLIIRPSGEIRHVISEGIVDLNPEGRPIRLFGVFKDITEEKLKDEELFQSNLEIDNILNTAQDLIVIFDDKGNFKKVSKSSSKILGFHPEEMTGKNFLEFVFQPDLEKTRELGIRIIAGELVNDFRNRYQHADGRIIHLSWSCFFDERAQTIFAIGKNISQLLETKEILRIDRQKLSIVLDSSPDTIWTLDQEYRLISANTNFLNLIKDSSGWEIKPGDMVLSDSHFSQDYITHWKQLYDRAFAGETFTYVQKFPFSEKAEFHEISLKPIFEGDKIICIACYSKDITQRKLEELQIEELVKRLNLAQKIGKLGYWEFDIKTQKIYWTDEVYQIWGIDKSRFHPNFDLFFNTIHPDDQQEFLTHHLNAVNGIAPLDAVHRIVLPTGEIKFVHEIGGLETDPESGSPHFRGTVQDITREKTIEKELLERNSFIESTLRNLSMGIAVNKISTGEATYINPAFSHIYGWPAETFKDIESFFEKIYPNKEYREYITQRIKEDIQSGDPARMEWKNIPITTQDGKERIVYAKNIPLPEQDLIISTVMDETDRYWAEHSLVTSNERFHLATQAVSDAIWDWDIKKNTIFWGKGYHRLFGYPADWEYVSEDLWQSKIHPEDLSGIWESIQSARNNKEITRWSGEYRFKKFDGIYAYVKENTVILRDAKGQPIRMVGALQDISLEKEKELQLQKKTSLISATAKIVESFLETDNWQDLLNPTLKLMGESVGADRAYLIQVSKTDQNKHIGRLTHEWTNGRASVELHNPDYQAIPLEDHTGFLDDIYQRRPFFALTRETEGATRQILEEQNIKSILNFPLFIGMDFYAYLGFDDCTTERQWSEDELGFIQAIGTNLSFAIERKNNLDKVQKTFDSRNSLLESIGDSFYAIDKDYKVTYWNNTVEKLTGVSREEILGKSIWDFVKNVNPDFKEAYQKAFKEKKLITFETNDIWVNAWLEVTVYPTYEGLSVIIRDISKKKEAERQIQEFNERFLLISKASQDAIWDWNIMTGERYWGEGFNLLFDEEISGIYYDNHKWLDKIHPEDRPKVSKYLAATLNDHTKTNFESEYRIVSHQNSLKYVVDKATIIRNKSGSPTRMVGAIQDITRRKAYEESLKILNSELIKSNRELEITNKELEQFAYVASHDLQEPLRMISSFLGLIEKKYQKILDEKGLQYIHFAVDGAKRMREIILDLLEFSRVGNITESKKPTDLNVLLQEVIQLNNKAIQDKNAIIHLDDLPTVTCHSNSIIQLFQNLISNALKYQPEGQKPEIWIEATEFPTEWRFEVRDNGIGIEPEFKEKIFIIFQRLHQKDQFSGSGIGLAICKKIVEFHGGKIWVESDIGEGSKFFFTLKK